MGTRRRPACSVAFAGYPAALRAAATMASREMFGGMELAAAAVQFCSDNLDCPWTALQLVRDFVRRLQLGEITLDGH